MPRQLHVAFYLPQFHPIPENDAWWGPGFTEWTNAAAARPLFRGHYQPHIPADLGFYDLRLPETRLAQAELATQYGIDAFCYYHYWFGGKRLLERPFDEVLRSGEPALPFCLAWANENWTRRWDGFDHEILMRQDYESGEREHAQWLATAFRDERYLRVDGRPVFLVYRAGQLPDPIGTTRRWRDAARAAGVGELFLCCIESFPEGRVDPASIGFDAAVEFAPDFSIIASSPEMRRYELARKLTRRRSRAFTVLDYERVMAAMLAKQPPPYLRFPCVSPGFDNSSRRTEPVILTNSTPDAYRRWVEHAARRAPRSAGGDSLVFVNAWNEWGEGAHLEPCRRWGRAYLEAHRDARKDVDQA